MNAGKFFCLFFTVQLAGTMPAAGQAAVNNVFSIAAEELSRPRINCLYQTYEGFILCGTSEGLYSFDGTNFSLFPSEKNKAAVTAITQDKNKRIWIGYNDGSLAEIKNSIITPLNFPEGNPKAAITSFTSDGSGTLWMATAGEGIYYFTNKKWYNINTDDGLSDDYIYKLVYMPAHGVIAATDRGINFCRIVNNKKTITSFTSRNGLPDNIVRAVTVFNDNELIAGMQDAGICFFNVQAHAAHQPVAWKYGLVNDIIKIQSKIYVAAGDSSLFVADALGNGSISPLEKSGNLQPGFKISCMIKDRESNLWVAGENMLVRINTAMAEKIKSVSSSAAEKIHCLYACSDTCLWVNDGSYIVKMTLHNGNWQSKTYSLSLPDNAVITSLYRDMQNNIWAGTLGYGIIILDPANGKTLKLHGSALPGNANIISISGRNGQVWVSALEGVVEITTTGANWVFTDYTAPAGIGSKYVYDIFTDHTGRTWFATDGDGVYALENGRFNHLKMVKGYMGDVV